MALSRDNNPTINELAKQQNISLNECTAPANLLNTSQKANRHSFNVGHFIFLDFDECHNSLCQNGGTCTNSNGDYRCECNHGYSGKNCHLGKYSKIMESKVCNLGHRKYLSFCRVIFAEQSRGFIGSITVINHGLEASSSDYLRTRTLSHGIFIL